LSPHLGGGLSAAREFVSDPTRPRKPELETGRDDLNRSSPLVRCTTRSVQGLVFRRDYALLNRIPRGHIWPRLNRRSCWTLPGRMTALSKHLLGVRGSFPD